MRRPPTPLHSPHYSLTDCHCARGKLTDFFQFLTPSLSPGAEFSSVSVSGPKKEESGGGSGGGPLRRRVDVSALNARLKSSEQGGSANNADRNDQRGRRESGREGERVRARE